MRLSNTLMMDVKLMPSTKKAFTLAEVLITLSILGVVAALTIPSLVNRQSDLAAQVKIKKAISNYEDIIGVYMAESEEADAKNMIKDNSCTTAGQAITDYFKAVKGPVIASTKYCDFVTADGVAWRFDTTTGNASVTDNENADAGRYAVTLWNRNNRVNSNGVSDSVPNVVESELVTTTYGSSSLLDTNRTMTTAPNFLQGNKYSCGKNETIKVTNNTADCGAAQQQQQGG